MKIADLNIINYARVKSTLIVYPASPKGIRARTRNWQFGRVAGAMTPRRVRSLTWRRNGPSPGMARLYERTHTISSQVRPPSIVQSAEPSFDRKRARAAG